MTRSSRNQEKKGEHTFLFILAWVASVCFHLLSSMLPTLA